MLVGFLSTIAVMVLFGILASIPNQRATQQQMLAQDAAIKQYQASLTQFQAEKQAQQASDEAKRQLEAATLDPIEANAIVQFTDSVPKLNGHYGTDLLATENRVILNQILARIHSKYLEIEAHHRTMSSMVDGLPATVVIKKCDDEVAKLENDLWTEIDSQLPVAQQKFLRDTLPLYASDSQPMQCLSPNFGGDGGGGSMGVTMPQNMGMPPGMGMGGMGMGGMGSSSNPSNLRYSQLLGWKSDKLPIRFTIGRRGKWFRWTIAETRRLQSQTYFQDVDAGEAPELPSGLRRFWREITANDSQSASPDKRDAGSEKDKNLAPPLNSGLPSNELEFPPVSPVETPERFKIVPDATGQPPGPVINDPNKLDTTPGPG